MIDPFVVNFRFCRRAGGQNQAALPLSAGAVTCQLLDRGRPEGLSAFLAEASHVTGILLCLAGVFFAGLGRLEVADQVVQGLGATADS
jgi:hypothetical protein